MAGLKTSSKEGKVPFHRAKTPSSRIIWWKASETKGEGKKSLTFWIQKSKYKTYEKLLLKPNIQSV